MIEASYTKHQLAARIGFLDGQPATEHFIPEGPEELTAALGSWEWRIFSGALYKITTKGDDEADDIPEIAVPFRPNASQRLLLSDLNNRNIVLKARQMGFCLDPSTRVLTADLRWVRIDSIQPGDELVATDEHVPGGKGASRKMRTATVVATAETTGVAHRIHFDDGRSVVCTGNHRWLSRSASQKHGQWRTIDEPSKGRLKPGCKVRWITKPWDDGDINDGWMGGMLDGEGSIANRKSSAGVVVSQRYGPVWERLCQYADGRGYSACVEDDGDERPGRHGKTPVPRLAFNRMDEMFRLIGQTRPTRFLGNRFWEGRDLPGKRSGTGWATITHIETLSEQRMIDLQTSTGTFIAEGFVSHNSTLIEIMALDHALFNRDQEVVVIAHTKEAATKLYRKKVCFAYDNMPEAIRRCFPIKERTQTQLVFDNGSSIEVTSSARGGTPHFLHISEMGKIAAKYPDKAVEITTGSLQGVPKNGLVFIESTAEGKAGAFYDMSRRSQGQKEARVLLKPTDYRFHFFAWWMDRTYCIDPKGVRISAKEHEYFDKVEAQMDCTIDLDQRAWYINKRDNDFSSTPDLMWREYPSCVVGSTRVDTPDGPTRIVDVVPDGDQITHHYVQGVKPVFDVTTEMGYRVTCTDDHPILCPDGEFRKLADGLSIGDHVEIAGPYFGTQPQTVSYRPIHLAETSIQITEDMALFLGMFMGDGSFHDGAVSVVCAKTDPDVVDVVDGLLAQFIGQASRRIVGAMGGGIELRVTRKDAIAPLFALGAIRKREGTADGWKRDIRVPEYIFRSPKSVVASFLSGLFEADGYVREDGSNIRLFSKDSGFLRDVQLLLLMFGIPSWSTEKTRILNGKTHKGSELRLRIDGVRAFHEHIGFMGARKKAATARAAARAVHHNQKPVPTSDAIATITPAGDQMVYDITTKTAQFIANGIVVHNCPEECWQASNEGKYYAVAVSVARQQGRIGNYPLLRHVPVNSFWDLGATDSSAIWLHQQIGAMDRWVRFYEASGQGYLHFILWMEEQQCVWGRHYLPHDAEQTRQGVESTTSAISQLRSIRPSWEWIVVPRIHRVQHGIELARLEFPQYEFDEEGTKEGIAHLEAYSRGWNNTLQWWSDEPRHDEHSHGSDSFRQKAQGYIPIGPISAPRKTPRRSGLTA